MYAPLISVLIVSIVFVNLVNCNEAREQSDEDEIRHPFAKLRRWSVYGPRDIDDRANPEGPRPDFDWKRNWRINKDRRRKDGRNSTTPVNNDADRIPGENRRQVERSLPEDSSINRPQPIPDERERSLPRDREFNRPEEKPEETLLERPETRPISVPSPNGQRRITRWQDRLDFI